MKNIFLSVLLLLINSCKSQNSTIMIPIVDDKFERFDEIKFDNSQKENQYTLREKLGDGSFLEMIKLQESRVFLTFPSSFFTLIKIYYPNLNIKEKGVGFNASKFNFRKGVWYEFDESGKLIKETDYDKPFKFTFEDILKFCEKENITVDKGPILQSTGWHTIINRGLENGKNPYWSIEWLKKPDVIETITLDGITGKVISREERKYINN